MDEEKAREILAGAICEHGLDSMEPVFWWNADSERAVLDDGFTAEQLEAIAWWMRNKRVEDLG